MELLEQHFDIAFEAPDGIKKLRDLILSLAMQGKLVPQDPSDPPASELLMEITDEKKRLFEEGKIKEPEPLPTVTADEVPYTLPNGWEWVRLGTFLQMVNGRAFKPTEWTRTGLPIVRIQNLNNREAPFNFCDKTAVKEQHIISDNEFLISWSGTPGTSFGAFIWYGGRAALNQHIFRCSQFANPFLDEFLRRAINSRLNFLISLAQGAVGLKHVTKGTLEHMPLPLPPRKEQVRIVARIDELMARCDELEKLRAERDVRRLAVHTAAIHNLLDVNDADGHIQASGFLSRHFHELYTVKKNVSELRKAILQLAVMGKLVPQDTNDPPASDLLKQIEAEKKRLVKVGEMREPKPLPQVTLKEIPYAVPHSWQWVRMGEVCNGITSGSTPSKEYFSEEDGVPFLKVYNIRNQVIDFLHKKQFVDRNYHQQKMARSRLIPGDVVMNIVGPPLGKTAIIPDDYPEYNCNQAIAVFRPVVRATNTYLYTYLLAGTFLDKIELVGTAGQDNISVSKSQMMPIPLPPLREQDRIVKRVNLLMTQCDNLEQQIDAASRQQTSLLNSLMAQFEDQRCA